MLFAVAILVLIIPAVVSAVTYQDPVETAKSGGVDRTTAQNVTFVAAQGTEYSDTDARVVAIQTQSKEVLWEYDKYNRYFDVDPLGENRVLFAAAHGYAGTDMVAVEMNWRTGEVYRKFPIPKDTHDLDHLSGATYAIAEKERRAYVYNVSTEETVWEYDFRDEYPSQQVHLNDIDSINNGSAFLLSPRNIDQVMLVNRSTNQTEWILGKEGNTEIINHQHNPVLLDDDPVTVLVADSENDRIIEYERTDSGWNETWLVEGLSWPRDADRLPNGNTIIASSSGQRVLEVTPQGEVVWEFDIPKEPYDIERLQLGDEPTGPTMAGYEGQVDKETTLSGEQGPISQEIDYLYELSQWIVPSWVTKAVFLPLLFAIVIALVWINTELTRALPSRQIGERIRSISPRVGALWPVFAMAEIVVGGSLVWLALQPSQQTTVRAGIGTLLVVDGGLRLVRDGVLSGLDGRAKLLPALVSVLGGMAPIALGLWSVRLSRGSFLAGLFFGLGVLLLVRGGQHVAHGVGLLSGSDNVSLKYALVVFGSAAVLAGVVVMYLATKPTTDTIIMLMMGSAIAFFGLQIADFVLLWRRLGFEETVFFLLPKIALIVIAIAAAVTAVTGLTGLSPQTIVTVGLVLLLFQALLEEQSGRQKR